MRQSSSVCVLYSRDDDLLKQIEAYAVESMRVRQVDSIERLDAQLHQLTHFVLVIDLRVENALSSCGEVVSNRHDIAVIALGVPRSEPMLEAERQGVYATEEIPLVRTRFQALLKRAYRFLQLQIENASLRDQVSRSASALPAPASAAQAQAEKSSRPQAGAPFSKSFRHINNLQALMENIVESVASSALVSRAGIFCKARGDSTYVMYAGIRCMEDTHEVTYDDDEALVHWLRTQGCQITRGNLDHIPEYSTRMMLKQELDGVGAEVILPLQGRTKLLGWMFLGNRGTGLPFDYHDLEQLVVMAEQITTMIENALLYEEIALQKTMAETLLQSIPTGIVSIDTNGYVRTVNEAAQQCLNVKASSVLNQQVARLGSRIADVLLRAVRFSPTVAPKEWMDYRSNHVLVVEAHRLMDGDACLGAVAMIHDVTEKRQLEEKQEQVERASFWNDLAASMSHEVRNPLVAIKTFAQLLPERYEDEEFRSEFGTIVSQEVDKLNRIIEQINDFANPPKLRFSSLQIEEVLEKGISKALEHEHTDGISINTFFDPGLAAIEGDTKALTECFSSLITNAFEATYDQGDSKIDISAKHRKGKGVDAVVVTITDNGPGIPVEFRDKVFSPFCTSKPRGMGLGLPIAKRIAIDHNGGIEIETAPRGTQVVVTLPVSMQRVAQGAER